MRRFLLGMATATMIAGTAAADIAPPKTKPTASKPKLETEVGGSSIFQGQSLMVGAAMSLAVVTGGLMLMHRRHPRTSVEV